MKPLPLLFLLIATALGATYEPPPRKYYTREEWNARVKALAGFDEIRLFEAERVREIPKWTKEGLIFEERIERNRLLFILRDIESPEAFVALLEYLPGQEILTHGCFGLFNVVFYREGEEVGQLHFAHGKYWAPLTIRSQKATNDWLIAHGFPIERLLQKDTKR